MNLYRNLFLSFTVLFFEAFTCSAQKTIPLYPNKIPNSKPFPDKEYSNAKHTALFKVSNPTLSIYLPPKKKTVNAAVIICPGGGYHALMIEREGNDMAKRFVKMGVAAFVLKYRLPSDSTMINKSIGPLQDAQQAIKTVRSHAKEWHIDPNKIGIMGFSAGGHLASTAGTHFNWEVIDNKEKISLRPDFMMLVYPVISMTDSIGHRGSRNNLLGKDPSAEKIKKFSNEMQVTPLTPPAFIVVAEDDSVVKVANSIRFYKALIKNKVPAALHIYQKGGHGFLKYPPHNVWMKDLVYWMKTNDLLLQ